jgi:hypothetical protein
MNEDLIKHKEIILDALNDYKKWFEEDNKDLSIAIEEAIKYMERV